ncbi:MAG: CDP-alcohol phosphatidyltransferase family protein [Actinomycetota bacterium]|nr:CDP-alcohol phosphatidyltransferase family protein [Actinomycetota bacterium]
MAVRTRAEVRELPVFDKRCRTGIDKSLRPVGSGLGRVGITANQLTATGILLSGLAALAIGRGWLFVGWLFLAASAIPDLLDGAVAKASGTSSPRGAFFDSVADRVSDTLVLGGVAWYLASVEGGHIAVLPLAVLAASNLISYERARAESLGFSARGGLMERAERMMLVGLGLLFSRFLVPILWVMLALCLFTAAQRFVMVWRQGSTPRRATGDRLPLRDRWRGWRPGEGFEPRRREVRARWRERTRPPRRG